ncbi:hypothetical protein WJ972_10705 [Achromobacter insuavis]
MALPPALSRLIAVAGVHSVNQLWPPPAVSAAPGDCTEVLSVRTRPASDTPDSTRSPSVSR